MKSLLMTIDKNYIKARHFVSDLTFLRHAQSNYNIASEKYLKEHGIHNLTWDQICEIDDFNQKINYNPQLIDTDLSHHGLIQCYRLKDQMISKKQKYDLVLISPMLRALRTCRYVFQGLPVKKIVLPELTEVFRYCCDVSRDIQTKRQQFNEFDFSRFAKGDNFWFLDTQPKQTAQKILKRLNDKAIFSYEQAQGEIVKMMHEGHVFETDYQLRLRAQKVKRIIEGFKKTHNRVIVISHHYMIQNLLAQGYRRNHQPVSSIVDQVPNAVPIETSVQQLLSVV